MGTLNLLMVAELSSLDEEIAQLEAMNEKRQDERILQVINERKRERIAFESEMIDEGWSASQVARRVA